MIRLVLAFVLALLATPALADPADGLQSPITVQSKFVPARTVQVWLPPDYASSGKRGIRRESCSSRAMVSWCM